MSFSSNAAFAVSIKQTYVPTDDFVTNKISWMHTKNNQISLPTVLRCVREISPLSLIYLPFFL